MCRNTVVARAAAAPRSVSLRAPRAVPMVARTAAPARRSVVTRAEEAAKEAEKEPEVLFPENGRGSPDFDLQRCLEGCAAFSSHRRSICSR